ncbi:dephospho-CoA kinase [Lewinella sp. W8]|uniref:dephospho-CoA kinase n=1 Tax=Lewinella sp. W8 TaxID=2528208 RepID=UPI0010677AAA|nr:dephospho-CoA kinase [Lewinella sp. W8]MTB53093.1 dephospho-CoA kinase [Lewinella sp. W8]
MPKLFCVTGNIGSGKSTVCAEFSRLGIPVYYADAAAKRLMQEDPTLRDELVAAFGPRTYTAEGSLDRKWLAAEVFNNPPALERLNGLVHPAVGRDTVAWLKQQPEVPYALYEAAITLEIGQRDRFDGIIVVAAPYPVRCTRVLARDGMTEADFRARADRQWTDERKEAAADWVINNDGRQLLLPQILRLHQALKNA